jgi:transposase
MYTRTQRRKHRRHMANPITKLPGFEDSLRLLVEEEGYSLTDVALMFDVSRERIRQLCERFDVGTDETAVGLNAVRVWSETLHRFLPIRRSEWTNGKLQETRMRRHLERSERRQRRQQEIVDIVRGLKVQLDREPSWREIWEALGENRTVRNTACAAYVLSRWDTQEPSTAKRLKSFRAATGTQPRPVGNPGHTKPRKDRNR